MASFYLSTPEASTPRALPVRRTVLDALGRSAALAMVVFRVRLAARRLIPDVLGGRRARGAELVISTPAERTTGGVPG